MNIEILTWISNFGVAGGAVFCGIIAIIQGRDKVNKTDCIIQHKEEEKRFSEGDVRFMEIKKDIQFIKEGIEELKNK